MALNPQSVALSEHVPPAKVGPPPPLSGIPCQNMHSLSKHAQNMNSAPFSATLGGGAAFMHYMLYVNCYSKKGEAKNPTYSPAEFPHTFPRTLGPRLHSLSHAICKSNLVPRNQWRIGQQCAASNPDELCKWRAALSTGELLYVRIHIIVEHQKP